MIVKVELATFPTLTVSTVFTVGTFVNLTSDTQQSLDSASHLSSEESSDHSQSGKDLFPRDLDREQRGCTDLSIIMSMWPRCPGPEEDDAALRL